MIKLYSVFICLFIRKCSKLRKLSQVVNYHTFFKTFIIVKMNKIVFRLRVCTLKIKIIRLLDQVQIDQDQFIWRIKIVVNYFCYSMTFCDNLLKCARIFWSTISAFPHSVSFWTSKIIFLCTIFVLIESETERILYKFLLSHFLYQSFELCIVLYQFKMYYFEVLKSIFFVFLLNHYFCAAFLLKVPIYLFDSMNQILIYIFHETCCQVDFLSIYCYQINVYVCVFFLILFFGNIFEKLPIYESRKVGITFLLLNIRHYQAFHFLGLSLFFKTPNPFLEGFKNSKKKKCKKKRSIESPFKSNIEIQRWQSV